MPRNNPLGAELDIANVPKHCLRRTVRVVRDNRRGDRRVVRRALRNQARVVSGAPIKILEVEPQIVEPVGNPLEDRVAGYR